MAILVAGTWLAGCQSMGESGGWRGWYKRVELKASAYLYTYEKARADFDAGRVMEAHASVLAMDKTRPDYPQAQELFDKKIEPARRKLLSYYKGKATEAESKKQWALAVDFFEQAASFAPDDFDLAMHARELKLRMRQMRFDALLYQRRKQDRELLAWLDGYDAPPGLDPQDDIFRRKRELYQDWTGDHARESLREARRHMRNGQPELAYVELESYLRFRPGDPVGEKLLLDAKADIPSGLSIEGRQPRQDRVEAKTAVPAKVERKDVELIEAATIEALIEQRRWPEARRKALAFRRQGGENADTYLDAIDKNTAQEAEVAFHKGNISFRRERLDAAVEQWQRAVELQPENAEYAEQLRRALRMQERLRVIRAEAEDRNGVEEDAADGS